MKDLTGTLLEPAVIAAIVGAVVAIVRYFQMLSREWGWGLLRNSFKA